MGMTYRALLLSAVLSGAAFSQTATQKAAPAVVQTADAGVARATLMDVPDVRILRVEIQPGATRSIHKHDDVRAHLFLPITGSIELTMGSEKMPAAPGQAFRMEKGTPHGFHNTGTTVAMVYEVFLRDVPAKAANSKDAEALALAFAAMVNAPTKDKR